LQSVENPAMPAVQAVEYAAGNGDSVDAAANKFVQG